ncbi:SDR family NAD(P)-dependent oxidoreductase [Arthrobacter zhaoguopingii]|uniref:SDR family NAD(P)-dependent oxidoreductase n=1 Tax=Arthrobacter zhaoguopingii TaxID=2681491 RepID=UPI00135C01E8|nr:SDR family NAD(P)-dependent oxidoreductase [Arthrobacter zhaoguopingii]
MSRILITGSADGLGRLTAEALHTQGHDVIVHARNADRAAHLRPLTDQGAGIVIGDFADRDAVRHIAAELADQAPLDAVIHNVGVWSGRNVMPVNIIAPYLLTALLPLPERLVYLSSGSHFGGRARVDSVDWQGKGVGSYGDSKHYLTTLAAAMARLFPDILSNSVDPGWVPTRMGGAGAPDSLELGHRTQEWLATSEDPEAHTSGGYWYHQHRREPHPSTDDTAFQDRLLSALADETGERLPRR